MSSKVDLNFDGLLFDLDGTLVDSSEAITRAWGTYASQYQLDINEIFPVIQGRPAQESIASLRPGASMRDIEEDARWIETLEAEDANGVVEVPGATQLLNALNQHNVPWAIVTSCPLSVASARMTAVNLPFPEVLVTIEQVSQGKPDPEPYVLGASKLGEDIKNCIVFEDSPAGVKSGVKAGALVIGLSTQFDSKTLMDEQAVTCINNYFQVDLSVSGETPSISVKQAIK